MTQPRVYSRGQIIAAALDLIRERGWSRLTTRAVARKLGSSTMPIYSHMRSLEELERELQQRPAGFCRTTNNGSTPKIPS